MNRLKPFLCFLAFLFSGCATGNFSLDPTYFYEWHDVTLGRISVEPDGFPVTVRDTATLYFTVPDGVHLSFSWGTTFSDAVTDASFYLKNGNRYALTVAPRKTGLSHLFVFAGPPNAASLKSAMRIGLNVESVADIAFPQVFKHFNTAGVVPKAYYSGKSTTTNELDWQFKVEDSNKKILAVLKKNGIDLKGATYVSPVPGGVRVRVRTPDPGIYTLTLFVGRPLNSSFDGLLSYTLAVSGKPVPPNPFPEFMGREGYLPELSPVTPGKKHLPEKRPNDSKTTSSKKGPQGKPKRVQRYDFSKIDRHALQAKPSDETSIAQLSKYLIREEYTEVEKYRSLFVWVTDRIAYSKTPWNPTLDSDLELRISFEVLKGRKAVCEGYASLFHQLANGAGLTSTIVSGMARSSTGETESHAWIIAEIDGEHYLIDPTWGAGFTWADTGKFEKRLQETYFLADPSELICSHFPDHAQWQLLDKPVSKARFESGCTN